METIMEIIMEIIIIIEGLRITIVIITIITIKITNNNKDNKLFTKEKIQIIILLLWLEEIKALKINLEIMLLIIINWTKKPKKIIDPTDSEFNLKNSLDLKKTLLN
jgi:hypothetical protein